MERSYQTCKNMLLGRKNKIFKERKEKLLKAREERIKQRTMVAA